MLGVGALAGCARPMSPSGWAGGTPDRTPPQLLDTRPEQRALVPGLKGPVVFRFDERISEQGVNAQTAILSPDTGRISVSRHGGEIRVQPRAGWKPGRIYHVLLLPTVKDLFGNQRTAPVELVFSTGPPIPENAVAGFIVDRLTDRPLTAALVQAVHLPDSLTYTTATDSAGFFAIRSVPEGRYAIRAFDDRNHDRQVQFKEPHGDSAADLGAQHDTLFIQRLALLPGDSTPARLTRAEPSDSTTIRLSFDDYLDPLQPQARAAVTVWRLPDSTAVPVTGPLFRKQLEALRAAADSAAARARARDTSAAARARLRDTSAAGRARAAADSLARQRAAAAAAADTAKPLPIQEMFVALRAPLQPKTRYRVIASRITNINGIPGGGGTTTFETAAAPKPPTAADSAAAARGGRPTRPRGKPVPGVPVAPKASPDTTRPPPRGVSPDTTRPARPARDTSHVQPAAVARDRLRP